jgi:hypothetical protein
MKPLSRIVFFVSVTTSLKNETEVFEDSFCVSVTTSLKNEIEVFEDIFLCLCGNLIKK